MKKLKYPEYINGIKQVQNPVHRFIIRIWYSEPFRFLIMFGIPYVPLFIYLAMKCNWNDHLAEAVTMGSYVLGWILGLSINDWSNLRKIGLTEYHNKIKENNK
jgi:hypothetical protein